MIYDKFGLIHLAIPKTGTSCIFDMLYKKPIKLLNEEQVRIQKFNVPLPVGPKAGALEGAIGVHTITKKHPLWRYYDHGHVPYSDYEQLFERYPHYKEYQTFTFVRNPYDIMVSKYFYEARRFTDEQFRTMTFNTFCKKLIAGVPWHAAGGIQQPADPPISTQTQFLNNSRGQIDIDFIGKLETFEEDWAALSAQHTSLPAYDEAYRQSNRSQKRDKLRSQLAGFEKMYDQETKDWVYEHFKDDFVNFDYPADFCLPTESFNY